MKNLKKSFLKNITNIPLWLSFIAGLLLVFSYAPFSQWWLVFIVLPLWFKGLAIISSFHYLNVNNTNNGNNHQAHSSPKLSSKLTKTSEYSRHKLISKHCFVFALGWFSAGISWVHVSIERFGGMPLVVSLFLMLLLCAYLALYPTLAGYITSRISKTSQLNLWFFPSAFMLCEYLRGTVLTGFPWLSLGYSQIDGPLKSLAPIIGETGITLTLLLFTVSLSKILPTRFFIKLLVQTKFSEKYASLTTAQLSQTRQPKLISLLVLVALSTAVIISHYSNWLTDSGKTFNAALIQGNIEQEIKWQPDQQWPTMMKYLDLSRINYEADVIVWPESAIPAFESLHSSQEFLDIANGSAALNHSAIITGILNYNFDTKEYFNRLVVLGRKNKNDEQGSYAYFSSNKYDKYHLLPIGEFVPFGDILRPLAPLFNLPMSSFSRGSYVQDNLIANDIVILPLICFEIAFADQLAANFTNQTQVLLTVSNDAWFGNSHGPHQHMEMARMRALEFGRPLLRATNNGVTAITDHLGNINKQAPQFEQAVVKAKVTLVTGTTPYSIYGAISTWLLPLLTFMLVLLCSLLAAYPNTQQKTASTNNIS